ncbi:hypothetical protein WICPIJ_003788 [Wickerhamomyces pijperi]|uniref:Uncharacterized protein n=1 Tax=Wickerhamomyces pijperi TaxID=599730 RepID=A0A9P8Q9B7_WICPI|nr:hypothetical protein WICPIJ_003788 [Wickerhamomyces pijperi]
MLPFVGAGCLPSSSEGVIISGSEMDLFLASGITSTISSSSSAISSSSLWPATLDLDNILKKLVVTLSQVKVSKFTALVQDSSNSSLLSLTNCLSGVKGVKSGNWIFISSYPSNSEAPESGTVGTPIFARRSFSYLTNLRYIGFSKRTTSKLKAVSSSLVNSKSNMNLFNLSFSKNSASARSKLITRTSGSLCCNDSIKSSTHNIKVSNRSSNLSESNSSFSSEESSLFLLLLATNSALTSL